MGFETSVAELYRAPHQEFIAVRKRLAGELAAEGDRDGAVLLGKLERPPISAWVVNQLWWLERATFKAMFESGARLHEGHTRAGAAYGAAVAKLRERAATLLDEAGYPASEPTLRRVTGTLAALAASGGFAPDRPGTLTADREPAGFETLGDVTVRSDRAPTRSDDEHDPPAPPPAPRSRPPKPPPKVASNGRVHPHVEASRRPATESDWEEHDAHTLHVTERKLLEGALHAAKQMIAANETEAEQLRRRLDEVERAIAQARVIVTDVEARLGTGDDGD